MADGMNVAPCARCGSAIQPGAAHCGQCGQTVGRDVPATAPMPQVPVAGAVPPGGASHGHALQPPQTARTQHQMPATAPRGRDRSEVMTQMAGAAMNMSEVFGASFKRAVPGWSAELAEPVGPSTGGGELVQQPISLVAQSGERLAIGRVDASKRTASIRSYDVVAAMCQQRFGRPFTVAAADYQRFVDTMSRLFGSFGLSVSHETMYNNPSSRGLAAPPPQESSRGIYLLLVLAAAVVALLVAAVVMILR